MARFYFQFSGRERDEIGADCDHVDHARNVAVAQLGAYLTEHPHYAEERHWRITVEDEVRRPLLNVIVATVAIRNAPV